MISKIFSKYRKCDHRAIKKARIKQHFLQKQIDLKINYGSLFPGPEDISNKINGKKDRKMLDITQISISR